MPELPEVETTIKDLKRTQPPILGAGFINIWTDFQKIVKEPKPSTRAKLGAGLVPHRNKVSGTGDFEQFKKELKGKRIQKIWRRGKNIIFELSDGCSLLVHQKLTGHLLYGGWNKRDKANSYVHLKFFLDNNEVLALSDLRKFAKVELWKTKDLIKELISLGPEPLEKGFTFEKFKEVLKNQKGKIKQVLMDQEIIAGIGNIYSDEILWRARVHPFKQEIKLSEEELKSIYKNIKPVLTEAIESGGTSISDYRNPLGKKGSFDKIRKVYRREGEQCSRCGAIIKRAKLAGRSAHFCPFCQK